MNAMLKKINSKRNGKKGFTLMEMLIVVAIIAVLVAIAIPTFSSALTEAKTATDKANIRAAYAQYQITSMLESAETVADVAIPSVADVKTAFAAIGVDSLSVYDNIIATTKKPWTGDGKDGCTSIKSGIKLNGSAT